MNMLAKIPLIKCVTITHLDPLPAPAPAMPQPSDGDQLTWIAEAMAYLGPQKRYGEMMSLALCAMSINKKVPDVHLWAGIALRGLGHLKEAEQAFRDCLALSPDSVVAMSNLGSLLIDLGPREEGIKHLQRAIEIQPDFDYPLQNLLIGTLTLGQLEQGWNLYARRLRFPKLAQSVSAYTAKAWDGLRKERVMIVGEEGPGERIMFASMIPDLIAAGCTPYIEMNGEFAKFRSFFARAFPQAVICTPRKKSYQVDSQIVAGDLGRFFRRRFEDFPKHTGFMKAPADRTLNYRRQLTPAPVVGLSWWSQGTAGAKKSIPLKMFRPILDMHDITQVSVQYGDTMAEQLKQAPLLNHMFDLKMFDDIDGAAAMIAACDLVITISNVTAHMAGALGVPCWLLLPRVEGSMWFWFRDREDSPWYPSVKIYRQAESGWGETMVKVAADLKARDWPEWKTDNTA